MEDYIIVKDAKRRKEAQMNNSLGADFLRYLTELVTNSDDSYRRLEKRGDPNIDGRIYIIINGKGKDFTVSVIDFAEGMSHETLKEKFGVYGSDKAGGVEGHVRGMFGQGGSDVLRNACYEGKIAQIESICNGMYTRMKYEKVETKDDFDFGIKVEDSILANPQLREKLGIKGNGTKFTFGVPQKVMNNLNKLMKSGLKESIEKYPSLRYLLDKKYSTRQVYIGKSFDFSEKLDSSKFRFSGDIISEEENKFIYKGKKIPFHLRLYNRINKEDDVTEIIVRDEDYAVYANASFVSSKYFRNIVGELEIEGLYKICYDAYNANPQNRELIFEDDRTGFKVKNEFYKNLNRVLESIIMKAADSANREDTIVSVNNKDLISALNNSIKELMQEDSIGGGDAGNEPPTSGIKFARPDITITQGKKYGLKLLINPELVKTDETIKITVSNNNDNIEVSPLSISYSDKDVKNGLVKKNITIMANQTTENPVLISASTGSLTTDAYVTVTHLDVHYPENGLEFYPKELDLVYNKPHNISLFVDSEIVPLDSELNIIFPGLEGEPVYKFTKEHIIGNSTIGEINVVLSGGELGKKYTVGASYGDISTSAVLNLIDSHEESNPSKGYISEIKFRDFDDSEFQSFLHPLTKVVRINTKNPINKRFLGEVSDLESNIVDWGKEQKKYVCEILTTTIAKEMVKQKSIKNSEINFDQGGEGIADNIFDAIQKFKNYMFNKLSSFFAK